MTTRIFSADSQPSLTDLKANLRITSTDLDAALGIALEAAISAAEHHIGQKIGLSTLTTTADFARTLELEGPVLSITSVSVDGVQLTDEQYYLRHDTLFLSDSVSGSDMEVVYSAGMSAVPADIKAAILLHAGQLFSDPVDSVEALPKASTNLLRPYRRWGIR